MQGSTASLVRGHEAVVAVRTARQEGKIGAQCAAVCRCLRACTPAWSAYAARSCGPLARPLACSAGMLTQEGDAAA